jgi:hypothetical protein
MNKYSINLSTYKDVSFINLLDGDRVDKTLTFRNKYTGENIFKSLKTEMVTYGDKSLLDLFNYYLTKQLCHIL